MIIKDGIVIKTALHKMNGQHEREHDDFEENLCDNGAEIESIYSSNLSPREGNELKCSASSSIQTIRFRRPTGR